MTAKIFVDGQEGTTGLRINEYLAARKDVAVLRIAAELRKDADARRALLNEADVAFLCLPDAAAREAVALLDPANKRTCIIDASTAHRTDPAWVFGLPELAPDQRAKLRASKRIANPGCHSTAFILSVRPLVDAGIIARDRVLHCHSITGYSGGGKKMIASYEQGNDPRLKSPRPYALDQNHKHLPEMQAAPGMSVAPVFTPIVGPFYKGLAVTTFLDSTVLEKKVGVAGVHAALAKHYAGERFVKVMPVGDASDFFEGAFDVQGANDTNRVDIFVFGHDERMVIVAREDNLGKGASGAAIQCMNIHLGVDEALGL